MRSTRMLWGMLCILAAGAAGACGEDAVPPTEARSSRDLDFVLPELRETPPVNAIEDIENPLPVPDWMKDTLPERWAEIGGTTTSKTQAYITDSWASGWFNGTVYHFEYGMVAWGTGFTMDPDVTIRSGDATLVSNGGVGRVGDFLFPFAMWPAAHESIDIAQECGAQASLALRFEARTAIKDFSPWRESAYASHSAYQARCPTWTGGGGGGSGYDDGTGMKICYYDVWVDQDGLVIDWFLIGCYYLGAPNMT